ncbi:Carboxypeptidase D [Bertholletia excelsa]
METNTNSNLLILFTILMMFHGIGISHGQPTRQADRLQALRRAKTRAREVAGDDKWVAPTWGGEFCNVIGKGEEDLIEGGLPGQPSGVNFKQFAGYVNVDESKGRSLFYYFVEAADNSSSKPLVLWLNGGPGCSSMGLGAMLEIGPFGVNPDGRTLHSRRHAWNRAANMLFLESPAGVGFSYSNTTSDYAESGDKRTAQDAYTFLVNWFRRYPYYKSRDFYIAGESYAGYYIPELADTILSRNKEADPTSTIHLKGIMIGNGIMNYMTDARGSCDYLWSHALISDETYHGLINNCLSHLTMKCDMFLEKSSRETGTIDFYNIYAPLCHESAGSSRKPRRVGGYDPCEGNYVDSYLNLPRVQQALHANRTKLPYAWEVCSPVISGWKDSPQTMFPIYRRLIASRVHILLYSGDVDAVVPVTGTQYSIDALGLKVLKPWSPWSANSREVAGYRVVYDGLTFATVRGAGHQVPQFQPGRALALFEKFIAGKLHP